MLRENTLEHFRQKSLEKIAETEHKQALLKDKLSQRSATTPQVGDIFVFKHPETLGIQWVVLRCDETNPQRVLIVPADDTPLVGSTDVELPKSALCSPLTLRCEYSLSIHQANLDMNLRVGILEERHQQRALDKLKQISEQKVRSSILQQETDDDLDYEEWMEQVYQAREVLGNNQIPTKAPLSQILKKLITILSHLYKKSVTLLSPEKMVPATLTIGIILGITVNQLFVPTRITEPSETEIITELFGENLQIDEDNEDRAPVYKGGEEQFTQEIEDLRQLSEEKRLLNEYIGKIKDSDIPKVIELLKPFLPKNPNYPHSEK